MSALGEGSKMAAVDVTTLRPIARPEATQLARDEAARMVEAMRGLSAEDWSRSTANELWDVRAMLGHVVGMTETFTGLRRLAADMVAGTRRARADGTEQIHGLTAVQVERTAHLGRDELIERLERAGAAAARWRSRRRLMRPMPMKQKLSDGTTETWRFGYLIDVILTRDTWMHRSDLAEATGRPMTLTAGHDGRIVADVVAEWARRHGRPFTLRLTGPAGGEFVTGEGGEEITLDAVEFCRILADRDPTRAARLLRQAVPF